MPIYWCILPSFPYGYVPKLIFPVREVMYCAFPHLIHLQFLRMNLPRSDCLRPQIENALNFGMVGTVLAYIS